MMERTDNAQIELHSETMDLRDTQDSDYKGKPFEWRDDAGTATTEKLQKDGIATTLGGPFKPETKFQGTDILRNVTVDKLEENVLIPSQGSTNSIYEILKFPVESSHSYSYARLSPNSLALRLNILKRSLEILRDRPNLFKSMSEEEANIANQYGKTLPKRPKALLKRASFTFSSGDNTSNSFPVDSPSAFTPDSKSEDRDDEMEIRPNASSAALAALFKPALKRNYTYVHNRPVAEQSEILDQNLDRTRDEERQHINDIISVLDGESSSSSEIASSLHDLSLRSANQNELILKQRDLINRLVYALATPFVETTTGSYTFGDLGVEATKREAVDRKGSFSSSNRPFHSIYSNKHSLPSSTFTVQCDCPWEVKAANDLAFLMFGVSKKSLKSLTLMDLIAPRFREFVSNRLNRASMDYFDAKREKNNVRKDIIFAGEIVAIVRPSDREYAWTSMWVKRTGSVLICVFDLIPCDAFNLTVDLNQHYSIEKVDNIAGDLVVLENVLKMKNLAEISESLVKDLELTKDDEFQAKAKTINETRYYTLDFNEENVPCALSSNIIEQDTGKKLRLEIHALPYISGMFVIDSKDYNIKSCNNAISKNLFGRSFSELKGKSINKLIPKFAEILNLGLKSNLSLRIVPGLVLPEHFFRRYDAALRAGPNSDSAESLFLNSCGLSGYHRDGKKMSVDVQLRVPGNGYFILWITHSRQVIQNIHPSDKSFSAQNILFQGSDAIKSKRMVSIESMRNEDNIPSQLQLFAKEGLDPVEFSPHSSISREGSLKIKMGSETSKALSDGLTDGKHSNKTRTISNPDSVDSVQTNTSIFDPVSFRKHSTSSTLDYDSFRGSYEKYIENISVQHENESQSHIAKSSAYWPTTIGNKRRTKKFSVFKVIKELGEGAYGKVVLVSHVDDENYKVIIKCIDKEKILVDTWVRDRKLGTICSEIQIMAYLNNHPHPCITKLIDFFEDNKYYYIEMPIFGNPPAIDLFDYIEIRKEISEEEYHFIFKQIVSAIDHLHKNGIAHRDIKDENVIVDQNGLIKLIDFGSAAYAKQGPFDVFVGTIDYASPEVLQGDKYSGFPQDIWALGILLYTILFKENPFYNVDEIMEGDLRIPFIPSEGAVNLIKRILVRDVSKRPVISDILKDPWLSS